MKFLLIREPAQGKAIKGKLYLIRQENSESQRELLCDTLENNDFKIPALTFPLSVTYSPKFKRPLPLIGNVPKTSTQQTQHRQLPNIGNCRQGAMLAPLQASVADDCVKYRSGIRIHPGTKPEHSSGCILVRTHEQEEAIKSLILKEKEAFIDVLPKG